jgi:endonuclease/exonuclease/phosphatase family metal-dependent hydrolase
MYDIEQPYGPLVTTTLRVVSWNVWARYGPWAEREQAITETLAAGEPDVVALVESWATEDDTQVVRLSDRLGLPGHAFSGGLEADGVTSGIGLLSRWPIRRHEQRRLGEDAGWDGGSVLFAEIDGPRGPIQVFTVLLAWRLDHSDVRQRQVRDVAAYIKEIADRRAPIVLCGDYNADPDSDEIRTLTGRAAVAAPGLVFYDAWEVAGGAGPGYTWSNANPWAAPALWPDRRIDYVFSAWPRRGGTGHPVRCEVVGADPVGGVVPSDHYGVLADLRY